MPLGGMLGERISKSMTFYGGGKSKFASTNQFKNLKKVEPLNSTAGFKAFVDNERTGKGGNSSMNATMTGKTKVSIDLTLPTDARKSFDSLASQSSFHVGTGAALSAHGEVVGKMSRTQLHFGPGAKIVSERTSDYDYVTEKGPQFPRAITLGQQDIGFKTKKSVMVADDKRVIPMKKVSMQLTKKKTTHN